MPRDHVVPPQRAVEMGATVVDLDDRAELGRPREHALDAVTQARVEEQHLAVGVLEQVEQLVVGVAVVDVDRDTAHLERRVLRDDVLDPVVEVERDLRIGLKAELDERLRQPGGLVVVVAPRETLVAVDERGAVTHLVGDRLPDVGEVNLHPDPPALVPTEGNRWLGQAKPCTA